MNALCWLHRKQIIIISAVVFLIAAIIWIGSQTILFRSASNSVCWITVDETGNRDITYLNRLFYESGKLQRQELPLENAALIQGEVDGKIFIVDDPPCGRFEPEYMDIYTWDGSKIEKISTVYEHLNSTMSIVRMIGWYDGWIYVVISYDSEPFPLNDGPLMLARLKDNELQRLDDRIECWHSSYWRNGGCPVLFSNGCCVYLEQEQGNYGFRILHGNERAGYQNLQAKSSFIPIMDANDLTDKDVFDNGGYFDISPFFTRLDDKRILCFLMRVDHSADYSDESGAVCYDGVIVNIVDGSYDYYYTQDGNRLTIADQMIWGSPICIDNGRALILRVEEDYHFPAWILKSGPWYEQLGAQELGMLSLETGKITFLKESCCSKNEKYAQDVSMIVAFAG